MVILDIKMLSGFIPEPESLKKVSYHSNLNRNGFHMLMNDLTHYRFPAAQKPLFIEPCWTDQRSCPCVHTTGEGNLRVRNIRRGTLKIWYWWWCLSFSQQLMKDKPHELNLEVLMDLTVKNLKPAVVKIYDYYQPSNLYTPMQFNLIYRECTTCWQTLLCNKLIPEYLTIITYHLTIVDVSWCLRASCVVHIVDRIFLPAIVYIPTRKYRHENPHGTLFILR